MKAEDVVHLHVREVKSILKVLEDLNKVLIALRDAGFTMRGNFAAYGEDLDVPYAIGTLTQALSGGEKERDAA